MKLLLFFAILIVFHVVVFLTAGIVWCSKETLYQPVRTKVDCTRVWRTKSDKWIFYISYGLSFIGPAVIFQLLYGWKGIIPFLCWLAWGVISTLALFKYIKNS